MLVLSSFSGGFGGLHKCEVSLVMDIINPCRNSALTTDRIRITALVECSISADVKRSFFFFFDDNGYVFYLWRQTGCPRLLQCSSDRGRNFNVGCFGMLSARTDDIAPSGNVTIKDNKLSSLQFKKKPDSDQFRVGYLFIRLVE